jgi:hypothetical protein
LYNRVANTDELLHVLHTPEETELIRSCEESPSDTFVQQSVVNGMLYKEGLSGYKSWGKENDVPVVKESESLRKYGFKTRRSGKNNFTYIFAMVW